MKKKRIRVRRAPRSETFGVQTFCKQDGFTTIGAACAILLTCALIFGCLWVARSESQGAGVQSVADAAALAAENEVAEFAIAVRVADATLLTLSLTGLSLLGVGSVCCCFPPSAAAGTRFIDAGKTILEKRDSVAKAEHKALNAAQDEPERNGSNAGPTCYPGKRSGTGRHGNRVCGTGSRKWP